MVPPEPSSDRNHVLHEVGRYTGFGLTWALAVLMFLGLGYWLDGRLGTLPWFTMLGAFLGAAGGFVSLYRGIIAAAEGDEESDERNDSR